MLFVYNAMIVFTPLLVPLTGTTAPESEPTHVVNVSATYAVGDRFHLEGSNQNRKQRHVLADGEAQPDLDLTTTITYGYDVEVQAVTKGRPTRQRCRITKLVVEQGTERRSLLDGTPTVVASLDEKGFTKILTDQGTVSDQALPALYQIIKLEPRRVSPEMLVASSTPRSPRDTWAISAPLAADYLRERELDVAPDSVSGKAQFVGVADVDGTPCDQYEARFSSEKLRLEGVLPDGMALTKATVEAHLVLFAPRNTGRPPRRESVDMKIHYVGYGNQQGVVISADHTAQLRQSWTRTELPPSNGR